MGLKCAVDVSDRFMMPTSPAFSFSITETNIPNLYSTSLYEPRITVYFRPYENLTASGSEKSMRVTLDAKPRS